MQAGRRESLCTTLVVPSWKPFQVPESSGAAVEQSEVESRDDQEGDNENAESAEDEVFAALVEARARNMELQDLNNELLSQVSTLEGEVTMLADKLKIE